VAANESRTLQITAVLKDFVTRNLSTIQRGIARFAANAATAFRNLFRWISPTGLALSGFATAWSTFKGGQTVLELLEGVDALNKLGDVVGTNVDRLLLLKGAFELGGASSDQFQAAIRSLSKAVGGVVDRDTKKLVEAFERLGISVEELRTLDAVDIFDRIAGGLERFGTAQERAGALARILPREFAPLFASLAKGQEEFRKLIATSQFFFGQLGEEGAEAAGRFADAVQLLRGTVSSIGRQTFVNLAKELAPTIERIAVFLAENREAISKGLAALVHAIVKALSMVGIAFLKLVAAVAHGMDDLLGSISEIKVIGPFLASGLAKLFDVPELSERAKEIREEARGVAKELVEAEAVISRIQLRPDENDPTGIRTERAKLKIEELRDKLAQLSMAFEEVAPKAGDLMEDTQRAASLEQMQGLLKQLTDFNNLPGLSPDMAPIIRAIFGDGGVEGAESEVKSFFAGFSEQFAKVRDQWTDFGDAGRDAANTIVDGGLDGLVGALAAGTARTKTWNQAWKDLARSMLADIARVIARLTVMQALSTIPGFGSLVAAEKGGVVEGDMGKPKRFAHGGIARGPTLAMFGEGRNAEAFVPLPDNRRIPVMLMGGGGGGPNITINVSAADAHDVDRMLIRRRETILGLWRHDVENRVGTRQLIQRTAR
jgi:hypothetical protein